MSHDPATDLRGLILANGLGFTIGVDIFPGPVRPVGTGVPIRALFLRPLAGQAPMRFMGQKSEFRRVPIEASLRWNDYGTGRDKMISVMNTLVGKRPANYLDLNVNQGEPSHSGPNEEGHHRFMTLFVMSFEEEFV